MAKQADASTKTPAEAKAEEAQAKARKANPRPEAKTARTPWYVIQVPGGQEEAAIKRIKAAVAIYNQAHAGEGKPPEEEQAPGTNGTQPEVAQPQIPAAPIHLQELFTPYYVSVCRTPQGFQPQRRRLLPGYVIAVTNNAPALHQALCQAQGRARLLGNKKRSFHWSNPTWNG